MREEGKADSSSGFFFFFFFFLCATPSRLTSTHFTKRTLLQHESCESHDQRVSWRPNKHRRERTSATTRRENNPCGENDEEGSNAFTVSMTAQSTAATTTHRIRLTVCTMPDVFGSLELLSTHGGCTTTAELCQRLKGRRASHRAQKSLEPRHGIPTQIGP